MKLATYKDGSRDGQLVVVSRDLATAHYASDIASRLQQVLDDWNFIAPQLQDLFDALNAGRARHAFPFDPRQCMAPLPRAYQWVCGEAYDACLPAPDAADDTRLAHAASDALAGACEPVRCLSEQMDIDFGAGLAVVTGDVAVRASPEQALDGVRLLLLVNDMRLRAAGMPQVQRRPAAAFGPVAVTPDELGEAWHQGRVDLALQTSWNGRRVGLCDAGADMRWHFGELIAQLCATRPVQAGSIVGTGPLRNRGVQAKDRMEWPKGYHSIADKRAIELQQDGQASTAYLRFGDSVRIEMKGRDGQSVFGAIDQEIVGLAEEPRAGGMRAKPAVAPASED